MKSTRERILQLLLNNPHSSINEIADVVNINAISARHHLTSLLADGLIKSEEVRHGVGRPKLVYSLTDSGAEQFPTRYLDLTNRLLDQLKTQLSAKQLETMFSMIANDIAADQLGKLKHLSLEDKLHYIQDYLSTEGYTLDWSKQGEDYLINEVSCPFFHVSKNHPEVCSIDQMLLSTLLSIPLDKIRCMTAGDHQCSFLIRKSSLVAR